MQITHAVAIAAAIAGASSIGTRLVQGSDPVLEPLCDNSALLNLLRGAVTEEVMPGQSNSVATACMRLMGSGEESTFEERCQCFGPIPAYIAEPFFDDLQCRPTEGSRPGQTVWSVWDWCDKNWKNRSESGGEGGGKTTTEEAAAGVHALTTAGTEEGSDTTDAMNATLSSTAAEDTPPTMEEEGEDDSEHDHSDHDHSDHDHSEHDHSEHA